MRINDNLNQYKTASKIVAKLYETAMLQCDALPTRNVDDEAHEIGIALMALLNAYDNLYSIYSEVTLSTAILETLNIEAADTFDMVFNLVSQKVQAFKGQSPPKQSPTPWGDQYRNGSTEQRMQAAKNRIEELRNHFIEVEHNARHVLSERYNIDFPPL